MTMKTAEEWIAAYRADKRDNPNSRKLAFSNGDLIRAVQADALQEYGSHKSWCDCSTGSPPEFCDCGFNAILAQLTK